MTHKKTKPKSSDAPPPQAVAKKPLRLEYVDPATLAGNPNNWRKHPAKQVAALKDVIAEVGWAGALLFNERTGRLIDGHARKEQFAGQAVPVLIGDWDEATEAKILATLDPIGAMAETDPAAFTALMTQVQTSSAAVQEMLAAVAAEAKEPIRQVVETPVPAAPKTPITKPGDLWLLGPHRLCCGDSTKAEDVARLMGGEKAALVVTDPPYGVSYVGKTADQLIIDNDGRRDDGLVALLEPAFKLLAQHTIDTAAIYIWHASSTRRDFEWSMDAAALVEKQYLHWVKNHFVMGHSDYHYQTEPCFYAAHRGHKPSFYGDRTQPSVWRLETKATDGSRIVSLAGGIRIGNGAGAEIYVTGQAPKGKKTQLLRIKPEETLLLAEPGAGTDAWQIDRPAKSPDHPTTKPTGLAAISIENSSKSGELVLDAFAGSGFVLLACEQLGRHARCMELAPAYCDVIIERWATLTGGKAKLA